MRLGGVLNLTETTMATKKSSTAGEAVLLRDCVFGVAGQLVTLAPDDLAAALEQGMADSHPDAIAAAILASKE